MKAKAASTAPAMGARGRSVTAQAYPASAWPQLEAVWSEVAAASPQASCFTDAPWTGAWMEVFAPRLGGVSVVVFRAQQQAVGICLLVRSRRRYGPFCWESISLNASGEPAAETTYIEYNTLLCHPGWEQPVAEALADHLHGISWDEIRLDGFTPGPAYEALKGAFRQTDLLERWQPSYYVDLAALRRSGERSDRILRRATRSHVRQNRRRYSELGTIRIEPAQTPAAALDMFEELAELSRKRWVSRTPYAVFAAPSFLEFHRTLIRRSFGQGLVQLLRCCAGAETVGLLYNLVDRGQLYNYQGAYNYPSDRRLSPGLLTLSEAIQWALDQGYDDFDHLAGELDQKRSLSSGARQLVWACLRRRSWKTRLLEFGRRGRRRLASLRTSLDVGHRKGSGSTDE